MSLREIYYIYAYMYIHLQFVEGRETLNFVLLRTTMTNNYSCVGICGGY